jgi:hypothetical protein
MSQTAPTGAPTRRLAVFAALFGFVAVVVSQSITEGGVNSWTSLPTWAGFAAVAALATLAPWIPTLSADARGAAWRAAAAGAASLWLVWALFVLPSIHRNVAFLFTVGIVASSWAVWSAPGRSPPAS